MHTCRAAQNESAETTSPWPLEPIAKGLDDCMGAFDGVQMALGEDAAYTRHCRFLRGECHER
jgi:hypothetical protein